MKKLFLFIICSAFSLIINAQIFYVENNATNSMNVTPGKFFTVCNTSPDCTMNNMPNIAGGGGTDNQNYPALCTNKNIMIFLNIPAYNNVVDNWYGISIAWCGTLSSWNLYQWSCRGDERKRIARRGKEKKRC